MSDNNDNVQEQEFNMDQFFDTLDKQVNGAIFDDEQLGFNQPDDQKEDVEGDNPATEQDTELSNLQKRYDDSSEEAKRLYRELSEYKKYEDYLPILEALREDPALVEHLSSYDRTGGSNKSIKERLNLDEDFVFDPDAAINDPNSDSANVLGAMIQQGVDARLSKFEQESQRQSAMDTNLAEFKKKHELSDSEYDELVNWSKQQTLTMDDIYYLKNRESREKEIARRATDEREEQFRKMNGVPRSLGSVNSAETNNDDEPEEFKILKAMIQESGSKNIFG